MPAFGDIAAPWPVLRNTKVRPMYVLRDGSIADELRAESSCVVAPQPDEPSEASAPVDVPVESSTSYVPPSGEY